MTGACGSAARAAAAGALALASVLTAAPAVADGDEPSTSPCGRDCGTFTAVLENDVLGERNQDRDYTNGFKVAWLQGRNRAPGWAKGLMSIGDKVFSDGSRAVDTRLDFEFGQQIYTPDDITKPVPDPLDRPYAGLLYGALGVVAKRSDTSLEQLQLVVGVVGPSARAKQVQRAVHRLIGGEEPLGWDTQLRDRAVGELRFQRTEVRRAAPTGEYTGELRPHYGVSLGNLVTSANVGISGRFGRQLPDDFGPPRMAPSLPGSGYFAPNGRTGWYAFGGIDLRRVARALVLDQRSTLGAGVDREPWVADAQLGISAYRGDLSVAYTQVWRSREYAQQRGRINSFGVISIVWRTP